MTTSEQSRIEEILDTVDQREGLLKDLRAAERDLKRAQRHVEEVKKVLAYHDSMAVRHC